MPLLRRTTEEESLVEELPLWLSRRLPILDIFNFCFVLVKFIID